MTKISKPIRKRKLGTIVQYISEQIGRTKNTMERLAEQRSESKLGGVRASERATTVVQRGEGWRGTEGPVGWEV